MDRCTHTHTHTLKEGKIEWWKHTDWQNVTYVIHIILLLQATIPQKAFISYPGNTNWEERLSTIDLLIKVALVKNVNNIFRLWSKLVVQGGQLYWAFPFSKTSLFWSNLLCFKRFYKRVCSRKTTLFQLSSNEQNLINPRQTRNFIDHVGVHFQSKNKRFRVIWSKTIWPTGIWSTKQPLSTKYYFGQMSVILLSLPYELTHKLIYLLNS